jgi:hypothetical protein
MGRDRLSVGVKSADYADDTDQYRLMPVLTHLRDLRNLPQITPMTQMNTG